MDGSVLGSRHLGCSRSSSLPRDRFSRFAPRIRSLWDTKVPSPAPAAPPAAHGAAGTIAPPGVIPRSSRRRCRASPPAWGGPSHKPRFRGGDRGIRSQGAPRAPRPPTCVQTVEAPPPACGGGGGSVYYFLAPQPSGCETPAQGGAANLENRILRSRRSKRQTS